LVGNPSFGLHGHGGTIFTTLNIVLAHPLPFENVEIGNVCSRNIDTSEHIHPLLLFWNNSVRNVSPFLQGFILGRHI
jgi:hypothetical protein